MFLLTLLNLSLPEQEVKFPSTASELDHTVVLRAESPCNFRVKFWNTHPVSHPVKKHELCRGGWERKGGKEKTEKYDY